MKKKKGNQGGRKASCDSSSSYSTQNSLSMFGSFDMDETSFMSDKSLYEKEELLQNLTVVLCNSSDNKLHLNCVKSSLKNIIFLHPSLLRLHSISAYVLVKGAGKYVPCVAYPLKNIKENTAVLPKDNFGFEPGEIITVHSYENKIQNADEVYFTLDAKLKGDFVLDYILKEISNRFIYVGMTRNFKIFDTEYSFTLRKIISGSKVSDSSHQRDSAEILAELCSKLSLEKPDHFEEGYEKDCVHSNSSIHDKLKNSTDVIPDFYMTSYKTVLKDITNLSNDQKSIALRFCDIGGLGAQLSFIKAYLNMFLGIGETSDPSLCGTLMLYGPAGTGKTLVLSAISKEYNVHIEEVLWYNIYSKTLSEAKSTLKMTFQRALLRAPSIIIMDEFNFLCPSKSNSTNLQKQIASTLSILIETIQDNKILIIAAANNSDYNDDVLKASKGINEKVTFHMPTTLERFEIFKILLGMKRHTLTSKEIQDCVESSQGFTGRDLLEAIDEAQIFASARVSTNISAVSDEQDSEVIKFSDVKRAFKLKKPSIVSSDDFKVKQVHWEDIGGMKDVKEQLRQLIEWPLKYPEAYKRFNITPSRGVLMFGPPGCSKTMIAKALATECQLNFISKNASELFDKYVGESEKAVRHLFAMARAKSPCIIFLDEIDALVAERGSSSCGSGVGDRIVTTLLTEIDGIEELHGVVIIAATNRPDMLDDALVRNGRINHFIYVPLPDFKTREDILKIQMKKRNVSKDFDFSYLAEKTEGYTGAEIVNICNEAAFQLLCEDFEAKNPVFFEHHFEKALSSICPRTRKEMLQFYESFYSKYCSR